jgi:hypothetical protein
MNSIEIAAPIGNCKLNRAEAVYFFSMFAKYVFPLHPNS